MNKNCIRCNSEFKTKPSHYDIRKYCSKKCMDIGRQKFELRSCKICKKQFKYYASVKNAKGLYCSHECKGYDFRKERPVKTCLTCNQRFECDIVYKQKKYCSTSCYGKSMEGVEKLSFWETATKEEQLARLKKNYEKFVVKNKEGCWGWNGTLAKKYGSLQYGGKYKSISAHVGSWLIHYGEIPNKMWVLHRCDNPPCTRPDHLFLGTPQDNVIDMIKKGRNNTPRGEVAPGAKLTDSQVVEIKKMLKQNVTQCKIAKLFNVHWVTIHDIKHGKTWKHIEDSYEK